MGRRRAEDGAARLTIGEARVRSERRVTVLIYAEEKGLDVQAIAFRIEFSPPGAVESAVVQRASAAAASRPLFESTPHERGSASFIALFSHSIGTPRTEIAELGSNSEFARRATSRQRSPLN